MYLLEDNLNLPSDIKEMLISDYNNLNYEENSLEDYIIEKYKLDIAAKYGNLKIKNPFGKASGQLSCSINQVKADAEDGLGFVILKTVISQDENENSSMEEWKVNAPKMLIEEITSKKGETGYTVTWKGRGWDKSFLEYTKLLKDSYEIYKKYEMPVIPSVQYHLPMGQEEFKESEYRYTTEKLIEAWEETAKYHNIPFALEQDFSATLSALPVKEEEIIRWVNEVPKLIRKHMPNKDSLLGIKLHNPPFQDEFQVELLNTLNDKHFNSVDVITCFNRLFDADRIFEGKKGVAYGGYDLSDRNLRVLDKFIQERHASIPISATGNICSGKMMIEYALRGATCGQLHTYFQIPSHNYNLKEGRRTKKALHELIFNPSNGLVASMIYIKKRLGISDREVFKFLDLGELKNNMDIKALKTDLN